MGVEEFQSAWELLKEAYQYQMGGDYDMAVELYKRSLDLHPTAEAFTFLGWTYRFQGKIEDAIAECKKAIQLDPEFGTPYNDIGAYLIEKGELRRGDSLARTGAAVAALRVLSLPPLQPRAGVHGKGNVRQGPQPLRTGAQAVTGLHTGQRGSGKGPQKAAISFELSAISPQLSADRGRRDRTWHPGLPQSKIGSEVRRGHLDKVKRILASFIRKLKAES